MQIERGLFNGSELKTALEIEIPKCKNSLILISAFITQAAIDWLTVHTPENINVHLICRLSLSDITNGATHTSALKQSLDNGWKVSRLPSLHAKIYSIDDNAIYFGSANLTNNGFGINSSGNLEACCKVSCSQNNLAFIDNIIKSSTPVDYSALEKIDLYTKDKKQISQPKSWPSDIFPLSKSIFVSDFFWFNPHTNEPQSKEKSHDIEILSAKMDLSLKEVATDKFTEIHCVNWLISKLKNEPGCEIYFGKLSSILHDELKDDPAPYRKNVKILIQNLLLYCQMFIPEVIEVSRPNHSQKIKLLVTS